MLNKPHHCPDWDFLFIRPGDPEMECCVCSPADDQARIDALWLKEREDEKNNGSV